MAVGELPDSGDTVPLQDPMHRSYHYYPLSKIEYSTKYMLCQHILSSGPRKGSICNRPATYDIYCGYHKPKISAGAAVAVPTTVVSTAPVPPRRKLTMVVPPAPAVVPDAPVPEPVSVPVPVLTLVRRRKPAISPANWKEHGSCSYMLDYRPGLPCYAYDFDDTIVHLRTSTLMPGRIEVLTQQAKTHNILVFSNQGGIDKGKASHQEIRQLMDTVRNQLALPVSFFYASSDDIYRKPAIGMFSLFLELTGNSPDLAQVEWYCGDAGGRVGDFNISDIYFANNTGLRFLTPEQAFQVQGVPVKYVPPKASSGLYARDIWKDGIQQSNYELLQIVPVEEVMGNLDPFLSPDEKFMIMMVGAQASGKSTVAAAINTKYGFKVINNDTRKVKPSGAALAGQRGIVIDNTNTKAESRQLWLELALEYCFNVITIHLSLTKPEVIHLTKYREANGGVHIPMVAIHTTFKYYNPPEGTSDALVLTYQGAVCRDNFNHRLRYV